MSMLLMLDPGWCFVGYSFRGGHQVREHAGDIMESAGKLTDTGCLVSARDADLRHIHTRGVRAESSLHHMVCVLLKVLPSVFGSMCFIEQSLLPQALHLQH